MRRFRRELQQNETPDFEIGSLVLLPQARRKRRTFVLSKDNRERLLAQVICGSRRLPANSCARRLCLAYAVSLSKQRLTFQIIERCAVFGADFLQNGGVEVCPAAWRSTGITKDPKVSWYARNRQPH